MMRKRTIYLLSLNAENEITEYSQQVGSRGTPQAVAKCAWPWLFVLAVAVCSFLLKMSKILG
jgi:hypothetical protein